jgi:hypothetical protein
LRGIEASEVEQPLAGFLKAVGDDSAFPQERLAASLYLGGGLGVDKLLHHPDDRECEKMKSSANC